MGKVIIQDETTKKPISLIGRESGICYGSDVSDEDKNYKRGVGCIKTNHGRTLEFPQIYMVIDGYSAKFARELYTHIGGSPTRVQASTRYINYKDFKYVVPKTMNGNPEALDKYLMEMAHIAKTIERLQELGVPKEDASMLLPLGMETSVVLRTNLRNLVDMSKQRMCSRAFWEYREFMSELVNELRKYGDEWATIVDEFKLFHPKCDDLGYCPEAKGCGRKAKKV